VLRRYFAACVENANTVSDRIVAPAFSSVEGNSGWFGESG
jgi:hypothetical protein